MPASDLQDLLARLNGGKPVAAVLLLGSDAYLREATRNALVRAVVPEEARAWAVTRLSIAEEGWHRILQQVQTVPMLAARQIVFAGELEALEKLDEESRDEAVKSLETYLADPAPFSVLVFEAEQLDQRMKLYKLLSEKALVVAATLSDRPEEREQVVTQLAAEMARELRVEIDPAAASELADVTDCELTRMHSEMEKLAAYVGDRKRITPEDVDLLVVTEKKYTIWQLVDLLADRKRDQALQFLAGVLREGDEPASIVGALAWLYRTLIQAQELPRGTSVWNAARELRLRRDTAEIALRQARRIPRAQLLAGLHTLYEADSRLKSGATHPRAIIEFVVAQLTSPALDSRSAKA